MEAEGGAARDRFGSGVLAGLMTEDPKAAAAEQARQAAVRARRAAVRAALPLGPAVPLAERRDARLPRAQADVL